MLAVPAHAAPVDRILLAYDGSPKAREALYISAYAAGRWKSELLVVTVDQKGLVTSEAQDEARRYLASVGVKAEWLTESGPVPAAVLNIGREYNVDTLIMGGYGHSPVVEAVLGSAVDQVLREGSLPTLICR